MMAMAPMIELLIPELVLLVGASVILMVGLTRSLSRQAAAIALVFVVASLWASWRLAGGGSEGLEVASLNAGPLVWYVRLVTLVIGALILLVNWSVPVEEERGEFFALILFSLCGVMLVSVANNLILLFLALELVSVPTYILIGLSRRDIRAQEATGKYFFLGAFAAAMTLYGFSFLYGAAGTMTLFGGPTSLAAMLSTSEAMGDPLVLLGLVLSLGGLMFKVAAVPFHFYVADVYEGAASPVTGMLGFVPKFAGFVAIIRVLSLCGWQYSDGVFWMLWAMAAATMLVGNSLALKQHNVKRMLAYSGVAHTGYVLVALVAGPMADAAQAGSPLRNGLTAIMFYLAVYGVMNLGAFAALAYFRKPGDEGEDDSVETLEDLGGAARRHPWASLALSICILGLMGFPLTGGFLGKLYVFSAALSASGGDSAAHSTAMIVLVVFGVLNAAIAAAYYLRILASCYLRPVAQGVVASNCRGLRLCLALCSVLVLAAFVRPGILFDQSKKAVEVVSRAGDVEAGRMARQDEQNEPARVSVGQVAD